MTQSTKTILRYLLAYLGIEAGFLFWRLWRQIAVDKVAIFIFSVSLIFVMSLLEYRLLFFKQSPSERRNLLISLVVMGVSLIITFISFCYGYALILNRKGYYDRHQLFFEYFQPDTELGYKAKPNLVDLKLASALGNIEAVSHSTDEFGFRADDSRYDVPIAVVGDSFGFGAWMLTENTWSEKLEDELKIPVTNYSASGYSLWQYNRLIEANVEYFKNQVVIYSIFANDLKNDLAEEEQRNDYYNYIKWERFRDPITYTITDLGLTIDSPFSLIFNAIRKKMADIQRLKSAQIENGLVLFNGYTGLTSGYFTDGSEQVVFNRLKAAKEISLRKDVKLVVVIFPSKESVYKDEFIRVFENEGENYVRTEENAYRRICNFLREQNIPCYDLTEDLRQQALILNPLYFSIDSHLNEFGNAVTAKLIADYLTSRSLTANIIH